VNVDSNPKQKNIVVRKPIAINWRGRAEYSGDRAVYLGDAIRLTARMRDTVSVAGYLCVPASIRLCEASVANLQIRGCFLVVSATLTLADARAEGCPTPADEIATDRPDVTNSSLGVPVGSFQSENGINLSARDGPWDRTELRSQQVPDPRCG
jgi:hypothetical protein